uniref:Uncharacterized protein n=1 Tax=Clastoptera arizonana TaxID=38151 RepID=A0A1B6C6R7_9HEMI
MADGTNHKVPKTVEKHKIPNMINRTTSECLRVGDSDKILSHPSSLMASTTPPKKKPSFQITSVTVGPHMSNDGGDDSADDLDESHTEDISDVIDNSRVTDIETPSYSEDTFSKDDVFFNSSTSLGSAPVIPTSSQYGLAIVSTPDGCGPILNTSLNNNLSGNELHVSVTDSVINLGLVGNKHIDGDMREIHSHPGRNERFKVVKIESTEPFKRGRWMCMDYLDHTMTQNQNNPMNTARLQESVGSNEVPAVNQGTGTDSGISVSEHQNFTNVQEDQTAVRDQNVVKVMNNRMDQQSLSSHSTVSMSSVQTSISPGQTMQFSSQPIQQINSAQPQLIQQAQSLTSVPQGQPNLINTNLHQSHQQHQMQQIIGNSNLISQQPTSVQNQIPHQQMNQPMSQPHQPMSQSHQQISQHQALNQPHQPMSQPHQPMSQPLQQMQPGVHIQQVPMQQQNINTSNIQQFQQQPQNMHQQMQQTSHPQNIQSSHQQNIQQPPHPQNMQQPILHQQHIQQTMQQPIPQAIQHQHTMTIPMQQSVNQVSVPQQVMHQQPMQQQTMQQQPSMQ